LDERSGTVSAFKCSAHAQKREVFVRFKFLGSLIASASLVSAPVLAQASSPAAKLSVAQSRAGAAVGGERLGEGSGGIIAAVIAAGIIAIAVLAAVESGDDDSVSP
jgi:ABC-type xylose transport system permease subunit